MADTITLDDQTRRQLVALTAIPNPEDGQTALTGIRIAGREAVACDRTCLGVVTLNTGTEQPVILPARPLAAALKMAGKDDLTRIHFHPRQAIVTVGTPTLPLDNPDDDEGLPPVAVDLTYLEDDGWPIDMYRQLLDVKYGVVDYVASHHIISSDRLAKIAKLSGDGRVRLEAPDDGNVWRVTTPYTRQPLGYLIVTDVDGDAGEDAR